MRFATVVQSPPATARTCNGGTLCIQFQRLLTWPWPTQRCSAVQGSDFELAPRYGEALNVIALAFTFAASLPLMLPILAVSLALAYWAQLAELLRASRRPPAQVPSRVRSMCRATIPSCVSKWGLRSRTVLVFHTRVQAAVAVAAVSASPQVERHAHGLILIILLLYSWLEHKACVRSSKTGPRHGCIKGSAAGARGIRMLRDSFVALFVAMLKPHLAFCWHAERCASRHGFEDGAVGFAAPPGLVTVGVLLLLRPGAPVCGLEIHPQVHRAPDRKVPVFN